MRKIVTVLFALVDLDTGLSDPELLGVERARVLGPVRDVLERHGGTVADGSDTLTAVFGVPAVHEDDALRAVRSAAEIRAVRAECRLGIATGEVLVDVERGATGTPLTLAARLAHIAEPGEVLLGTETLPLVGDAVDIEPHGAGAFRLVAVRTVPGQRRRTPMVGRVGERRRLEEAFGALASGRCQLFTILGDAGVGKSRLVAEFLDGLDAAVVRGRCLPYGEGIT
jgi:class 3 adenylate cyclase